MHSFEVHSNESACRKSGRPELEQVKSHGKDYWKNLRYVEKEKGFSSSKLLKDQKH